jgi:hypothetical protein
MRRRCLDKKAKDFIYYGGRGISFCKEWDNYAVFYAWAIMSGYRKNLTLDRVNNDGDYSPSNCRWTTRKVQARNTRKSVKIFYNGKSKTPAEWAEITGIRSATIRKRVFLGWSVEKALTTPVRKQL